MFHGEASYAFIMGIISGYPVGAKIVNKFLEENVCTRQEAERMLAFTNNSGPLFIIGTVGISLYGYSKIGIVLFITHILACLTVGVFFGLVSRLTSKKNSRYLQNSSLGKNYKISDLGNLLSTSITNATSTIMLIGGFIVLFSIIISMLNSLNIIENISSFLNIFGLPKEYSSSILIRSYRTDQWCKCYFYATYKIYVYTNNYYSFLIGFCWSFYIFANF